MNTKNIMSNFNKVSKMVLWTIIFIVASAILFTKVSKTKEKYNFLDLQMQYKNYILVEKVRNGEEYKFTLRNPITEKDNTVYVEYYLYHHVYFVGDNIK